MYYFVPEDCVDLEKIDPHSTCRRPSTESGLYLWNQSLFILSQLLTGGLLHINELDPIRRYLPSYNRPRKGGRYSAFQVSTIYIFIISVKVTIPNAFDNKND